MNGKLLLTSSSSLSNVANYTKLLTTLAKNSSRQVFNVLGDGHCGATAAGCQVCDEKGEFPDSAVAAAALMRRKMQQGILAVDNHSSLESLITHLMILPNETIPCSSMPPSDRAAALAVILKRRGKMHADLDCAKTTMDEKTWCGSLDFKAAALICRMPVYIVCPWGAIEIHSPERDVKVVTQELGVGSIIPRRALVVFLTTARDHYGALVRTNDDVDDFDSYVCPEVGICCSQTTTGLLLFLGLRDGPGNYAAGHFFLSSPF
jgi:hypothetical protein